MSVFIRKIVLQFDSHSSYRLWELDKQTETHGFIDLTVVFYYYFIVYNIYNVTYTLYTVVPPPAYFFWIEFIISF